MSELSSYRYCLVVDLEATCCDKQSIPRDEMETIEIGATMVALDNFTVAAEFQSFVKPVRHPILTPFCTKLTTITQAQVENAPFYPEVSKYLAQWLSGYKNVVFGSWGQYDLNQLQRDSRFHAVPIPIPCPHINLKQLFSDRRRTTKRYGMTEALRETGIEMEGTHHRGIDDARNIAKLLPFITSESQYGKG